MAAPHTRHFRFAYPPAYINLSHHTSPATLWNSHVRSQTLWVAFHFLRQWCGSTAIVSPRYWDQQQRHSRLSSRSGCSAAPPSVFVLAVVIHLPRDQQQWSVLLFFFLCSSPPLRDRCRFCHSPFIGLVWQPTQSKCKWHYHPDSTTEQESQYRSISLHLHLLVGR